MKRIGLLLSLALFMCAGAAQVMALELKFSHVLPSNETVHEVMLEMGKDLEKSSNGYFKITVYANSELGNNKDNLEQLRRGANIVAVCDSGYVSDYVPAYGAMHGPFLFSDWKELRRLGRSKWHEEMKAQCYEKGMKILQMDWSFGNRHVISGKEIRDPADMKGLKIRVPPNKVWIDTITAMGGSPTVLQWAEVYSGLAQGVVDGAEAPLSTMYGSKLQEVKKNISLTKHFHSHTGMIMSRKVWESIPPEHQKLLQEKVDEYGLKCSELTAKREQEWQDKLTAEGVKFNESNMAAFVEACKVVYDNPNWPKYDYLREQIENTPFE